MVWDTVDICLLIKSDLDSYSSFRETCVNRRRTDDGHLCRDSSSVCQAELKIERQKHCSWYLSPIHLPAIFLKALGGIGAVEEATFE